MKEFNFTYFKDNNEDKIGIILPDKNIFLLSTIFTNKFLLDRQQQGNLISNFTFLRNTSF